MPHDPHDHAHLSPAPAAGASRAFAIGAGLNLAYVLIEAGFGLYIHSTALLADAGHNLSDVAGLLGGLAALRLGRRGPTAAFTYGMRRASVLAALGNAVLLLVATGAIALDAAWRLVAPTPTEGFVIAAVSGAGIVVNGVSAWLLMAGRRSDLNLRAAFTHMAADVALSAGVAVAGIVIALTGWLRLDPAVSLILSAVIVASTWELLQESVSLSLDAVPEGIDAEAVLLWLHGLPGVTEVHDLHIWGLSTTETALTAHLVRADAGGDGALLALVQEQARTRFGIGHATVQLEAPEMAECCELRPADVI
ncbi:MAG TPA: cation diffusion facilitator family transporter [Acetobacteraceae bacterium]|nr:cation diffusion facilitator family transporter [Acetobacteraceae bacterium]